MNYRFRHQQEVLGGLVFSCILLVTNYLKLPLGEDKKKKDLQRKMEMAQPTFVKQLPKLTCRFIRLTNPQASDPRPFPSIKSD